MLVVAGPPRQLAAVVETHYLVVVAGTRYPAAVALVAAIAAPVVVGTFGHSDRSRFAVAAVGPNHCFVAVAGPNRWLAHFAAIAVVVALVRAICRS